MSLLSILKNISTSFYQSHDGKEIKIIISARTLLDEHDLIHNYEDMRDRGKIKSVRMYKDGDYLNFINARDPHFLEYVYDFLTNEQDLNKFIKDHGASGTSGIYNDFNNTPVDELLDDLKFVFTYALDGNTLEGSGINQNIDDDFAIHYAMQGDDEYINKHHAIEDHYNKNFIKYLLYQKEKYNYGNSKRRSGKKITHIKTKQLRKKLRGSRPM